MNEGGVFCGIVRGTQPASVVWQDDLTPGVHRAALMPSVARITRAVAAAFLNQGMSLWHSIGEAADQEAPHLRFHVHPRMLDDQLLRVYPSAPALPDTPMRDRYAETLRAYLN